MTVLAGDTRTLTYQNSQGAEITVANNAIGFRYEPIYPVGVGVGALEYGAPVRTDAAGQGEIAGSSSYDTFSP